MRISMLTVGMHMCTSKILLTAHKDKGYLTSLVRALQHEASILKELDAMPPDEFRTELRDSFNILREYPQEIRHWGTSRGQALVPQVHHQDSIRSRPTRGPMPVPSDEANATAVEPPADAAAAPPPAPAAEAAATPPEKPAPPTPLAKKGSEGNKTGGRAGRC
jgi:hypothetical protein